MTMEQQPAFLRSGLSCHLFIYLVREEEAATPGSAALRFCTVLAYGRSLEAAERVAINRVHQQGLHIVRTDTATPAPWLDPARDGDYFPELARYGCAFSFNDAQGSRPGHSATAA